MADGDDVISDGVEGEGLTMTSSVPAATNQCRGFETIGPVRISSSWTDQSMIVIFFWATLRRNGSPTSIERNRSN